MAPTFDHLIPLIRARAIDAELAALVWVLAEGGLPVHVTAADPGDAAALKRGLEDLVRPVRVLTGGSLDAVLEAWTDEPARIGVAIVVDSGRVVASHWVRPPIRDGAGHVRAQGPAVMAVWDAKADRFEHFAWGVMPELAAAISGKAGDIEAEVERRAATIAAAAGTPPL